MKRVQAATTQERILQTVEGLTRLYDLVPGSHLSRSHVVMFLGDTDQPAFIVSDVIRALEGVGVEILDAADNAGNATPNDTFDAFIQQTMLTDLRWLQVDPEEYRKTQILPRENHDIAPDLAEMWDHSDTAKGTHLIPNRPRDPSLSAKPSYEAAKKAASQAVTAALYRARTALYVGKDFSYAKTAAIQAVGNTDMPMEFRASVRQGLTQGLTALASEAGLLGHVYVRADDAPKCRQTNGVPRELAATRAPFVLAKDACTGCVMAQNSVCSQFHKRVVMEVPYTPELAARFSMSVTGSSVDIKTALQQKFTTKEAAHVEVDGKPVVKDVTAGVNLAEAHQAVVAASATAYTAVLPAPTGAKAPVASLADEIPYERIAREALARRGVPSARVDRMIAEQGAVRLARLAMGAQKAQALRGYEGTVFTAQYAMPPTAFTAGEEVAASDRQDPTAEVLRAASDLMNAGETDLKVIVAQLSRRFLSAQLRQAFASEQGKALSAERGLKGVYYVDASVYPNCRAGKDGPDLRRRRLAKQGSTTTVQPLVLRKAECRVCSFAQNSKCSQFQGQLVDAVDYSSFGVGGKDAARTAARMARQEPAVREYEGGVRHVAHMEPAAEVLPGEAAALAARQAGTAEVVLYAKAAMNEGLTGENLKSAMLAKFTAERIARNAAVLKPVLAEQGLLGTYYIDPAPYSKCASFDGVAHLQRERTTHGRTASTPFVLKKAACDGCVRNRNDRCAAFRGMLVDAMDYTAFGGREAALNATLRATPTVVAEFRDDYGLQRGDLPLGLSDPQPLPDLGFLQDHEFTIDMGD